MLFYFLRCDEAPEVQLAALSVIVDITSIKDCVASIAESGVMSNILILIEQCPQGHELALEALHALSSNTKIVGELLLKGALLFLLNMFCSSRSPGVRLTVATVFARMAADKLNGPRVTIQLAKFLPPIFMDAMRENAEASVHMFESNQENPELVWDESVLAKIRDELITAYKSRMSRHTLQDWCILFRHRVGLLNWQFDHQCPRASGFSTAKHGAK